VSEEVARAMAEGAMKTSGATLAVAVTGIAGPSGATANKPVGLVHIACARAGFPTLHLAQRFSGDRSTVRMQAVTAVLELVQRQLAV
jgi:nicotinamide-nucleotide amidase